jgi:serine/threonine-protein kinase
MPEPAPTPASADRNLLFGILALQMDFVGRDALLAAMNAWVLAKHKPLGQILVEQGELAREEHDLVEAVVHRHVLNHGGDPRKSLAALSSVGSVRQDLERVPDPDLHASLAQVSAARASEADLCPTYVTAEGVSPPRGQRFRVLRPHAKGGLGEVFVAHDEELHREVALKEIQERFADRPEYRSRFLLEAEITGCLEHPGVVPVYGLGRYPDGRPYYAMRFVKGDTLQQAIDRFHRGDAPGRDPGERRLALRGLLRRFVDVCNAVGYAHSRGVLHRDLKPANAILGDYGETLVVDWGLAKVVRRPADSDGAAGVTLRPLSAEGLAPTHLGVPIGTPAFMSPEQAAGQVDALGPAGDVYSLGATLYCLLTGRAPFDGRDVGEILQRVQRGEFRPPRQVKRGVPAALEAVCLKAMAPRPADRYGTARALADDIEHWLADEPVAAHREPWPARLARWGRRHRPLVAAALALLVTAVVMLAVGVVVVNRERQAAEAARTRTRQALDEMSSQVIEDWLAQKKQLEPAQRAFLEKALGYYEEFAKEAGHSEEVRRGVADAHFRVGKIRSRLGQHAEAEAAYVRARELYARLGADFPAVPQYRQDLARSYETLGNLLKDTGRPKEAEASYRDALDIQKQLVQDFPGVPQYRQDLAMSHNSLGILLYDTGRPKEAEASYRDALDIQKQLVQDFPGVPQYRHLLARSHNNLGILLRDTGHNKEAEEAYHHALELYKALAAEYPAVPGYRQDLATTHNNLGNLLKDTGHNKEAEEAYHHALELQMKLVKDFPAVPRYRQELAGTHTNLGVLLSRTNRLKEAEGVYADALKLQQALAADFPAVPQYREELAKTHGNLTILLQDLGRRKEAEGACRETLDLYKALAAELPAVHDYQAGLANVMIGLADLTLGRKDYPAARRLLEEARPHLQTALEANPRHPFYRVVYCENRQMLAATLLDLGDHAAAAEAAADLARVAFNPAGDAYKAAGFFSRCVPLAEKDAKLPEAKRKDLAKSYADWAVEALRQAVAKGYKDAAHMKKDKDLDPLRGRDDFRKLLTELEAAAKPEQKKAP